MGDVFCLIILQSGNRRKLKLTTGTYVELLEKLAGIVEFDSESTLIQIFDVDLDDFVDLLPGDAIPNKAKLRVFSRSASTMCGVPVSACGFNAPPACPPPQAPCASKAASVHGEIDVSLQACDAAEIQETGDYTMETSESVLFIEIPRLPVISSDAAVQTIAVAEGDTPGGPCGTAVTPTHIQDEPSAVLPNRTASTRDVLSEDNTAPSAMAGHNRDDCLKFELPPSFGISCDTLLENRRPVTAKVRRHIVTVLFKACCKMTLYPTNRLYNRVLDSLVTKYPHVVEGKYDRRRWLIALKSRFKTARQKLPEFTAAVDEARKRCGLKRTLADADGEHAYGYTQHTPASQKSPPSPSTDLHLSQDKPGQQESGGPDDTSSQAFGAENSHTFETAPSDSMESFSASDPTESRAESQQPEEEESLDCPDYSDAVLEDVTDTDLLGPMCTDEVASETLMAEEGGRASPDKSKSCDEPAEEVTYYTRVRASPDKRKNCDELAAEVTYYTRVQASPDKRENYHEPAEEVTHYTRSQASPDKRKSCDKPAEEVAHCTRSQASPDKRKSCEKPAEEVAHCTRSQASPDKRKSCDKPAEEVTHYTRSQASPDKRKSCEKPAEEVAHCTRSRVSPDKRKGGNEPTEEISRREVRPSPDPEEQVEVSDCEPDCEEFKLPSFGIFDDLLKIQVPVNTLMQRHIVAKLFDALCKVTVYPSTYQYDEAVDSLLQKYPHLSTVRGKTGKEFWKKPLKAKFNSFRTKVAGNVWKTRRAQSKYGQVEPDNGASQHTSRPLYIDVRLSEDNDKACQQSESEASSSADSTDYRKQVMVAKARHVAVREMTVEKAISTFPMYRKESSLLGEFNILWKADIADCFEKGIKKLFLILMHCGTDGEIQAMSEPGNDILMVVLNAIARRCGERLGSLLIEDNALSTPCLVTRVDKSVDLFVNRVHLFTASSLLGGLCALFASFWVFHIEYSEHAKGILTFLEHAFLDFTYTTPQNKSKRLINLYKRASL